MLTVTDPNLTTCPLGALPHPTGSPLTAAPQPWVVAPPRGRGSHVTAMVLMSIHAALLGLLGLGFLATGASGLAVAVLIEGVLRVVEVVGVAKRNRVITKLAIGHSAFAAVLAILNPPLGLVFGGVHVATARLLQSNR